MHVLSSNENIQITYNLQFIICNNSLEFCIIILYTLIRETQMARILERARETGI